MRTPPLILVVDDNPENVEILQLRLSANNYEVITATDGEAGLAMARNEKPDLILLDIMMPKMDGLEVCRRLKGDPSLPFMPIVMVSAKADSKDVVAGLEAGGDEYLTKPVNQAALVARVKSMLRIKSLHDTVVEQSSKLQRQLETAKKIQSLFWPEIPDLEGGSHVWGISKPASYVGGDLYDVIPLTDGSVLAYVADVSDKGVPAALIMAALSAIIRGEARTQSEVDKLLVILNNRLHKLTSEEGFFATIALIKYRPDSGIMQLSLGGHLEPLWIVEGVTQNSFGLKGVSLGITRNIQYEKKEIVLSPGESMLFFTDGVIEAENEKNELFGNVRLHRFAEDTPGPPWGKALLGEIASWRGKADVNDDLTILEIWRDPM